MHFPFTQPPISIPFAPVSLGLGEKEQLLSRVANTIIGEALAMYMRFLGQDKGCRDPVAWELTHVLCWLALETPTHVAVPRFDRCCYCGAA
jgi:hypothetical protein